MTTVQNNQMKNKEIGIYDNTTVAEKNSSHVISEGHSTNTRPRGT